jgi:tetratricopeptide (TPR) repeat protein
MITGTTTSKTLPIMIALLALGLPATAKPPRLQHEPIKRIYVVVRQSQPSSKNGDLRDFTYRLLQLYLSELKQFTIERSKDGDPCSGVHSPTQVQIPEQTPSATPPADTQNYYLLQVSIDVRQRTQSSSSESQQGGQSDREIVLDYELLKYEQCARTSLLHSAEPFPEKSVMKYLNNMADVVSLRLETESAPKKYVVDVDISTSPNLPEAKDSLTNYVLSVLIQSTEFEIRDKQAKPQTQADYTVRGELTFPKNKASVKFTVTFNGRSYSSLPILGPAAAKEMGSGPWPDFYKRAASACIKLVNDVRYATELNLTTPLSEGQATALLAKAFELMCAKPGSPKDCQRQPESAIPLLSELTTKRNDPALAGRLPTLFELLGDAQLQMENYAKAAEAFDEASNALKTAPEIKADRQIGLTNKSGDAWYLAKNYKNAVARYQDSLQLSERHKDLLPVYLRTQFGVHLQLARSYRFDGDRLKALAVLLESLQKLPPSADVKPGTSDLEAELKDLVKGLRESELAEGIDLLQANKDVKPAADLLAYLVSLRGAYLFLEAFNYYQQTRFDLMDDALKQLESLPQKSLLPTVRAESLRLRGIWYRDNKDKKDLDRAEQLLQQAIELEDSKANKLDLAMTYYAKGQQQATPGENYKKAADMLAALAREQFEPAYTPLRTINHLRLKDDDSRAVFKEILDKGKEDVSAMLNLQYVYKYLGKFDNALELAQKLEQKFAPYVNVEVLQLDLAETYLLNGRYAEADERLAVALQKYTYSTQDAAVLHFYRIWSSLAQMRLEKAREADAEWRKMVEAVRSGNEPIKWIFDGAKLFLRNNETCFQRRVMLINMIEAMESKTRDLPALYWGSVCTNLARPPLTAVLRFAWNEIRPQQ